MAKRKRVEAVEQTPLDLIREAVEAGGYPHKLEQQSDGNILMTIEVAPNVQTTAVFYPDGRPIPPPHIRELIEQATARANPPQMEPPANDALESITYDVEKHGKCSEVEPCRALQVSMKSSCVEHGGIVGITQGEDPKVPEVVGFIPPPEHRKGHLFAFNFCPYCGHPYQRSGTVLGVDGPTTLQ